MKFCHDLPESALPGLLARFGMRLSRVAAGEPIPGSHWGGAEAGLIGDRLYVRGDTPLHSALHETCHYICMDARRRATLHTDAGGDYLEECGVCYLQILLAEALPGCSAAALMQDMDDWGYSFRLGSTARWFHEDADDALAWLSEAGLIDAERQPRWVLRG